MKALKEIKVACNSGEKILLEKDENGSTPLHLASEKGHKEIVAKLLRIPGGMMARHVKDNQGMTPWDVAEAEGHTSIARMLDMAPAASCPEVIKCLSCPICSQSYTAAGMKRCGPKIIRLNILHSP